jgi:hypothetical protein
MNPLKLLVPPVPDWDQLGEGLLEELCLPVEPEEDSVVLESLSELVLGQLTDMDKFMLLSPKERWSSVELPDTLKSQVIKVKAGKKKSKWADRLAGTWSKSRSKHWQNVNQLSSGQERPVPHASKRKAEKAEPVDGDSGQLKKLRKVMWKGSRKRGVPVNPDGSSDAAALAAALPAGWIALPDSDWIGQSVRTVCDFLSTSVLNRTMQVRSVRQNLHSGEVELRMQDDRQSWAYCKAEQVVLTSDDSDCIAIGPSSVDYRKFIPQSRAQCKRRLPADSESLRRDRLAEAGSIAFSIAEIQQRLPATGVTIMSPLESAAVSALDMSSAGDLEQVVRFHEQLSTISRLLVVLHSVGPRHYTLLQADRDEYGGWQLVYMDSLKVPSESACNMAQTFAEKAGLGPVPGPSNGRFQSDGWSCGLYCIHFIEESVRQFRGEPLIRTPVALSEIIARTNKFMLAVQQVNFEVGSDSAGSVKRARLPDSGPPAAAAAASAIPPSSAPADGDPPAAETSSALPAAAADTPSSAPADGDAPVAATAGSAETLEKLKEFSFEDALAARDVHSKCRKQGCAQCMQQWFVPRPSISDAKAALQFIPHSRTSGLSTYRDIVYVSIMYEKWSFDCKVLFIMDMLLVPTVDLITPPV